MSIFKRIKVSIVFCLILLGVAFNGYSQNVSAYIDDDWQDSRYTDHGDGTSTDSKTGLMWKRCSGPSVETGDRCENQAAVKYYWHEALDFASTSSFAGYTDWRLPNLKELLTLAALNKFGPAINSTIFPNTVVTYQAYYYTSTPLIFTGVNPNFSWVVDFSNGVGTYVQRGTNQYVRLVRAGK